MLMLPTVFGVEIEERVTYRVYAPDGAATAVWSGGEARYPERVVVVLGRYDEPPFAAYLTAHGDIEVDTDTFVDPAPTRFGQSLVDNDGLIVEPGTDPKA